MTERTYCVPRLPPGAAAAIQLGEHDVASVAIHPGRVRTEGVLQFADQVDLSSSQSPEGVGGPSPRWPATRR